MGFSSDPLSPDVSINLATYLGEGFNPDNIPKEDAGAAFSDIIGAAARQTNMIASFVVNEENNPFEPEPEEVPGFDPFDSLDEKYQPYAMSAVGIRSPVKLAQWKSQIDQELLDRQLLAENPEIGIPTQIFAGLFDPSAWIPLGAFSKVYTAGKVLTPLAKAGRAAAVTGVAGVAGAAVSEIGLHASQETRTFDESLANMGTAGILSGMLGMGGSFLIDGLKGRFGKNLDTAVREDFKIPLDENGQPISPNLYLGDNPAIGLSADALAADKAIVKGPDWFKKGIKFAGIADPTIRAALHPFESLRVWNKQTNNVGLIMQELPGTAKLANEGGSVESAIFTYNVYKAKAREWRSPYKEYLQNRKSGVPELEGRSVPMNEAEFNEAVSWALWSKDQSRIPEVAKAAKEFRAKVLDPVKRKAQSVKNKQGETVLPTDDILVKNAVDDSYFHVVHDYEVIARYEKGVIESITDWLRRSHPDLDSSDLYTISQEIRDHILGLGQGSLVNRKIPLRRGPLKEKVFDMPAKERVIRHEDGSVTPWVVTDLDAIADRYVSTMASDIELTRMHGDVDGSDVIKSIREEARFLRDQVSDKDPKAKKKRDNINSWESQAVNIVTAQTLRLRGKNPMKGHNFWQGDYLPDTIVEGVKTYNVIRQLGGVVLGSLGDTVRPIWTHGIVRTFGDGYIPMIRLFADRFKGGNWSAAAIDELKDAGIGLEMLLNTQLKSAADLGEASLLSRGGRTIAKQSTNFSKWSGIALWNDNMYRLSGYITSASMIRHAKTGWGSLSKIEREVYQSAGINANMLKRWQAQIAEYGVENGPAKLAGLSKWTDADAHRAYTSFVNRKVRELIVTPGQDKPFFASTPLGGLMLQYKSFAIAAMGKMVLPALQRHDMAVLNGFIASVFMGSMVYGLRTTLAGRELSDDPAKWVLEGIDRSGVLAYLTDANNIVEKATRGHVGLNALINADPMSRYASRSAAAAIVGPTFGLLEDASSSTGAMFSYMFNREAPTAREIDAGRRLIPYQNHIALMWPLNKITDAMKEYVGAE